MARKVSLTSDICQLCYAKIPIKSQQKHLIEYHRLHVKALLKTEALQYWYGTKAPIEAVQEALAIDNKVLVR